LVTGGAGQIYLKVPVHLASMLPAKHIREGAAHFTGFIGRSSPGNFTETLSRIAGKLKTNAIKRMAALLLAGAGHSPFQSC